jgi:class 3 adenylate cyclase
LTRRRVEEFQGQLVKTTDDGILATFDGPGRGIRCAAALQHELRSVGGFRFGRDYTPVRWSCAPAMSVAWASTSLPGVMASEAPGEILMSRTVRDLVVGSDITLHDRGSHVLKGLAEPRRLFAVARS